MTITTYSFKKEDSASPSCLERLDSFYYLSGERYVIEGQTYYTQPSYQHTDLYRRIALIVLSCLAGIGLIAYAIVGLRRCYYHYQIKNSLTLQQPPLPQSQPAPPSQPLTTLAQQTEPPPQPPLPQSQPAPPSQPLPTLPQKTKPSPQLPPQSQPAPPPQPLPTSAPQTKPSPQPPLPQKDQIASSMGKVTTAAAQVLQLSPLQIKQRRVEEETARIQQDIDALKIGDRVREEQRQAKQAHKMALEEIAAKKSARARDFRESFRHLIQVSQIIAPIPPHSFLYKFGEAYEPKKHTLSFHNKEFALITRFPIDFSRPVAFIGSPKEPIYFIDPSHSPELQRWAERLLMKFRSPKQVDLVLQEIQQFMHTFFNTPAKKRVLGDEGRLFHGDFDRDPIMGNVFDPIPLVSIERCFSDNSASSLEKSLILAYFLDYLIKQKILPPGIPLIMFDNIENAKGTHSHAWNQFFEFGTNNVWHIDTYRFTDDQMVPVSNLKDTATVSALEEQYSPTSIQRQIRAIDSVTECLSMSGRLDIPEHVKLCFDAGGSFISKTESGVDGLDKVGPRYHVIWQLILKKELKFSFYKSQSGANNYTCVQYVNHRFIQRMFDCSTKELWIAAIQDALNPKNSEWIPLPNMQLFSYLGYRYINGWSAGRSIKEVWEGTLSRACVVEDTHEYYLLYREDSHIIRRRIARGYIKRNNIIDLRLLIETIATLTNTSYTDALSARLSVQKSEMQARPVRLAGFYDLDTPDRQWDDCYASDQGKIHEWPGFARMFTLAKTDFEMPTELEKDRLQTTSEDLFKVIKRPNRVVDTSSLKKHAVTSCLLFKNRTQLSVQAFFKYLNEEYGLTSKNYYYHCRRDNEILAHGSPSDYATDQMTGNDSARISTYLDPLEHIGNKTIGSAIGKKGEIRLIGFAFPKDLEEIVYKEALRFFQHSHQTVLEFYCTSKDGHLPKETIETVSEYLGVEGIKLKDVEDQFTKDLEGNCLIPVPACIGIKEMFSLGQLPAEREQA